MKKATSITLHTTAEGKRMSITYSEIDENGKIIESNKRIDRVVIDDGILAHITALDESALAFINAES
jgi:hypothetical protein